MNAEKLKELIAGFDLQTDLWWLAMLMLGLLAAVLGAFAFPQAGVFLVYLSVLIRLSVAISLTQYPWGAIFGKLLALGLVTGIFAIFSDFLEVVVFWKAGRLTYLSVDGKILASPPYVPLAWACMIVEFGYPILRLYGVVSKKWTGEMATNITMLAGGLLAALMAGSKEYLAIRAGAWRHEPGHAVIWNGLALYSVVAKFFVFSAFLRIFARYLESPLARPYAALRYGIIFGGVLFASTVLAYLLVMGAFV